MGHLYLNATDIIKNVHRYYVTTMLICGMLTDAVIPRGLILKYLSCGVSNNRCHGETQAVYSHLRKTRCSDLRGMIPWLTSSSRVRLCWSLSWRTAWRARRCGERHEENRVSGNHRLRCINSPSSSFKQPCCDTSEPAKPPVRFHLKLQSSWVEEGVKDLLHTSCSVSEFCLPVV